MDCGGLAQLGTPTCNDKVSPLTLSRITKNQSHFVRHMAAAQQWQLGPQDHQLLTELFPVYFPAREQEHTQTHLMSKPEVQEASIS